MLYVRMHAHAILQNKISFLEGERRGQDNLKRDLLRRIKMLEYALQTERYAISHNGSTRTVSRLHNNHHLYLI